MYLLDTNICIFLKNKKSPNVLQKIKENKHLGIYISSITVAELQFGVYNSKYMERNRISLIKFLTPFSVLNFDDRDAEEFGKIRTSLKNEGKIIGAYDMLIAAQALAKNLILVTDNTKEFCRIKNLTIEDWK
ncbi:type II toxin-antitoxin system tRNA(fMet)-specific endonuclease VapC [Treponema putidum]|uniref:Type II toxin-antitoxin system VapC family toxin n=1 Tax=Treponema putidum TaxID=221027 RepID=A0ABY5HXA5_9SPIR|nr:type II toxin-antitoxin system VapC family toxin [Treponema putidum]UTY29765.1 type II toxin-antitoxin system VapC family toxin [Treponema putidum]UTY32227.1 type II toxin-antitoxin system VapC family toxin [Treponema putidum]